jgi:hypothetical protein
MGSEQKREESLLSVTAKQRICEMSMHHPQLAEVVQMSKNKRVYSAPLAMKKSLLHTLVELMGCEAAQKMVSEFGGTRIWVPVRGTPEAKLTQVLGNSAASALCARFGGDYLQVPNSLASVHSIHRRIAELHRQGCKINDIALAVGRSRRTVFRLLRKKITDIRT